MKKSFYFRLLLMFMSLAVFASCSKKEDDGVDPNSLDLTVIESSALSMINSYRTSKGLTSLQNSTVIYTQAKAHSDNMAAGSVAFGHDGFQTRVDAIAASMSITSAAENVAFNSGSNDPAKTAYESWLGSVLHLANIEGDYTHSAIAVSRSSDGKFYFTHIFVKQN